MSQDFQTLRLSPVRENPGWWDEENQNQAVQSTGI